MAIMKKCGIISYAQGVTPKSIANRLSDMEIQHVFISADVEDLKKQFPTLGFIIMVLNEDLDRLKNVIRFLKINQSQNPKPLLLVAENFEYNEFEQKYRELPVTAFFEKPFQIDEMEKYITEMLAQSIRKPAEKKKILIVDDDPVYAKMVRDWLRIKYSVGVVTEGMKAVAFLQKKPVDLVLLDYEMPGVSGPQVFQLLKATPATAKIPVVFLTGVGDKNRVLEVLSLKPDGYLLKRSNASEVMEQVQEILRTLK